MKYIVRKIRPYWSFTKSVIQVKFAYRFSFFMFVLGGLIKTFVVYYLWKAVFTNSTNPVLNGFTSSDMVTYIFISAFTMGLINNDVDSVIGNEVKDGSISINLIKPISYHFRMLFHAFGGFVHQAIFVSIPLWICLVITRFFYANELPPDIKTIFVYIISVFMGFLILFLFNFSFGLLSFYITNLWGVWNLKRGILGLLSGEIIPIAFFPVWMQNGLQFIPFGSMNYIPLMIYLKKITGIALIQALAIQLLWIIFMVTFSFWIWNKAIKRLTILGG